MKPNISILLPSLREQVVKARIKDFEYTNPDFNYEIIVVSPFKVEGNKVIWIQEHSKSNSVSATRIAYYFSKADYIIYFSDDVIPTIFCLENIYNFIKQKEDPFIAAFKMITPSGKEIGPFGTYDKLYACYGCLSKNTIDKIGGFWPSDFLYSWADIDMSLRCWEIGGKVEICQNAVVIPNQIEDEVYKEHRNTFQQDFQVFLKKWHHKLGRNLPEEIRMINKRIVSNR